MTLVNDDRRDITIVFNAPEDFTLNGDELKATSKMHHCYVKGCGFVDIRRVVKQSPHSKSYILNTSNYPVFMNCLLYTSPSPRDRQKSRMPSSA